MTQLNFMIKGLIAGAMLLTLMGCGSNDRDDRPRIGSAREGRGSGSDIIQIGQGASANYKQNIWGEVIADEQYQSAFQEAVRALVSSMMDPQELGTVSGRSGDSTGVRFNGRLTIRRNGEVRLNDSKLHLVIWDSYVGQRTEDGKLIQEIPIYFSKAKSIQVDSQRVRAVFSDEYGDIIMSGQLYGEIFAGELEFQNRKHWNGGRAYSGTLGIFQVRAEGFLDIID